MKHRLTRKLLLIVAIPVTFELALFSACAVMLNLAEAERANESRTINVMARMAPVLVSTISGVTLTARALVKQQSIDASVYSSERLSARREIESFEKVASQPEFREYQEQIRTISEAAGKLNECLIQAAERMPEQSKRIQALFDIRDAVSTIDRASQRILQDLKQDRRALAENDAIVRRAFHFVLWTSLALSVCVAIIGLFAFDRLLAKPLKELMELSVALSAGSRFTPTRQADDEIGDLSGSFEYMAVELEKRRRIERAIFANSADIICTIDTEHRFELVNNAAESLLGYKPEELIGRNVDEILPAGQRASVKNQLDEIGKQKSYGSFESTLVKNNGTEFDVVWSVRWSEENQLLYSCLYNIDFEKKTEKMAKTLRAIVVTELRQSLHDAKDSIKKIIHSEAAAPEKLTQLDSNISRIIDMLNSLGEAISRESTDIPLTFQTASAEQMLQNSLESVSLLAKQKLVEIELRYQNIELSMDAAQIQRVIVNLLSNAIKASPQNGKIAILARQSPHGEFVDFEITDQGPGIPLNKQHLLFERFNQIGQLQSEEGKGSGLGLYSARKIVEGHGGTIGVISDGRNGCTFRVVLPARPK